MDAELSALVTAVPVDGSRAEEWFTTVRAVWEDEQSDLDAFLSRLREEAGHLVDANDLDLFRRRLDDLGGDPMDHLRRLAEHGPDELAAHLREPTGPRRPADAEPGGVGWIRPDQSERLTSAWGPDWERYLADQLDYRWGAGWEANPPDHKAEWLDDVLADLLPDAAHAESPPAESRNADSPLTDSPHAESPHTGAGRFDWVPDEQSERLASAWGPDWRQYLGEQLDHRWGAGWAANPDDHKAAWLPELVEDLLTPADDIPAQPPAPDAEPAAGTAHPPADQPSPAGSPSTAGPAETADYSAEDIRSAVDEVIAEVPGAENLSEEELAQIRADVAAALAGDGAAAQ